jgi:hypothetical protein
VKVEAGKFYLDTIGAKVGPMLRSGMTFFIEAEDERYWQMDGIGRGKARGFDLVIEWEEPAAVDAGARTGYECLANILIEAHDQAARGKGAERHANGKAFEDQPILTIARQEGAGFLTGQVLKKVDEARGMVERGDAAAARREFLGAIVYLAARVRLLDEEAAR